jgi:hypothetical protein
MKKRRNLFLLLLACALVFPALIIGQNNPSQTKIKSTTVQSRNDIVPVVDYHMHLLGPYALPLPDPLPPEVKLPAELERLLIERAQIIGNVGTVNDFKNIFTEDAQLLTHIPPTPWERDKHWFMRYLNLWSKTDRYRFAPNHYSISAIAAISPARLFTKLASSTYETSFSESERERTGFGESPPTARRIKSLLNLRNSSPPMS